jgi:hypothetical protein
MNTTITEDMAAAVDETADFMHTTPPPFPTIEHAVGIPPCRPSKLYTAKGLVTPFSRGITITGREQGEADMHRRDAIKRGGL